MRRLLVWAGTGLMLALALSLPAWAAGERLALVIGNDNYAVAPRLQNAVADAVSMRDKLEALGFKVTTGQDLDFRATNRLLSSFETSITPGATVFVYFAGHGISIGGANYLLPTDIERPDPGAESLIKAESYNVDDVIARLRARAPTSLIAVIDACRNNPFEAIGTRGIGADRGLARVDAPAGVLVLFSAGAGQTALDRLGSGDTVKNSVFTRVLTKYLSKPGLSHILLAKQVQTEVRALARTQNHEQQPAFYDQIDGEIILNPTGSESSTKIDPQPILPDAPQQDAKLPPSEPPQPVPAPAKAKLGVTIKPLSLAVAKRIGVDPSRGVLVVDVAPGSVAMLAGIRKDDVIVKLGSRTLWEPKDLIRLLADVRVGAKVPFKIWRGGREVTVDIIFDADPDRVVGPSSQTP